MNSLSSFLFVFLFHFIFACFNHAFLTRLTFPLFSPFQEEEDVDDYDSEDHSVSDLEFASEGEEPPVDSTAPFTPSDTVSVPSTPRPGPSNPSRPSDDFIAWQNNIQATLERILTRLQSVEERRPFEGFSPPRRVPPRPSQPSPARSLTSSPPPAQNDAPRDQSPSPEDQPPLDPPQPMQPPSKLPLNRLPKGWKIVGDGFALGETPGTLVLPDGHVLDSNTVEVDEESYIFPVWRMRKVRTPGKPSSVIYPVRDAYDAFASFLASDPVAASEWSETTFHPPGSSSSRALEVSLTGSIFVPSFFDNIPSWFSALVRKDMGRGMDKKKLAWDEATCPANFVPRDLTAISPSAFVDFFSEGEFPKNQAAMELNALSLPPVPSFVTKEEHKARTMFLSTLNIVLPLEAILLRGDASPSCLQAIKASIKASLQPLWSNFSSFASKKLALRKRALKGCLVEGENYLRLLSSNPLSTSLFDPQEVKRIRDQAALQAKSTLQILGFTSAKRSAEGFRRKRVKRPRVSPAPQQVVDPQPGPSKPAPSTVQKGQGQQQAPGQSFFKSRRSANSRPVILNLGATAPLWALLTFRGAVILRGRYGGRYVQNA